MRYEGSAMRTLQAPPALGEHTEAVLTELCDLDEAEVDALRDGGVIP
jgi:crotonobetainyl-CoA:carnitine CoA-transferase CaiB-like acyl-CoA transferase